VPATACFREPLFDLFDQCLLGFPCRWPQRLFCRLALLRFGFPLTVIQFGLSSVRQGVCLKDPVLTCAARIVVIEDNDSDVFLLGRALKLQNFQFEMLHLLNGREALAFIRKQGVYAESPVPSLILMDLNLSKYTGEDILREIRAAKHLTGIPVCAWSSSQSTRDRSMLEELGVSQFITKPAGLDQFLAIGKLIKDLLTSPVAARA